MNIFFRVCFALLLITVTPVMAQSSAEFDRLMTALSNSAAYSQDEYRQIEKIIKWVQDRQSPPATPEAARRHMARGEAATEMATDPNGYQAAIREFKAATRLAPWLADPHYNLGILQDRIKQYDRAIKSLTLYLLAAPDAGDRYATQSLIYKIEFKKEQAGKSQSRTAQQKPKPKKPKKAEGRWDHLARGTWCRQGGRCDGSQKSLAQCWTMYDEPKHDFKVSGNRIEIRSKSRSYNRCNGCFQYITASWIGTIDSNGSVRGAHEEQTAWEDHNKCAAVIEGRRVMPSGPIRGTFTGEIYNNGQMINLKSTGSTQYQSGLTRSEELYKMR